MANMKKLFLTLALLLPVTAMAQPSWTTVEIDPNASIDGTPVYLQVNVNGVEMTSDHQLWVGAFIDDDFCGRVDTLIVSNETTNAIYRYMLRVLGDGDTDGGKTINFRVYYDGIEYGFTKTATFQADFSAYNSPGSPLVLNVDMPTDARFSQDAIIFEKRLNDYPLPWTEDISSYLVYEYQSGAAGATAAYSPLNESTILSDISYNWDSANQGNTMKIALSGMTATITDLTSETHTLAVTIGNKNLTPNGIRVTLISQAETVYADGISYTGDNPLEMYTYENLADYIRNKVTVSPDDATDKGYDVEVSTQTGVVDRTIYNSADSVFYKGGEYTVTLTATGAAKTAAAPTATFTVKVYERPTDIGYSSEEIYLAKGEDVYAALEAITVFTYNPDPYTQGYVKNEVAYTFSDASFVDATTHKALKGGQITATVSLPNGITVTNPNNPGRSSFTVTLYVVDIAYDGDDPLDVYSYESVHNYLASHVTVTGNDPNFDVAVVNEGGRVDDVGNQYFSYYTSNDSLFTRGGIYNIILTPTALANSQTPLTTSFEVHVWERPTNIQASQNSISLGVGDDIYAAIKNITTISYLQNTSTPQDSIKDDVTYTFREADYAEYIDATTHKALKLGTLTVTAELTDGITPQSTFVGQKSFTVTVNIVSYLSITGDNSAYTDYSKGETSTNSPAYVYVSNPNNEPFDPLQLTIEFENRYPGFPFAEVNGVTLATDGRGNPAYVFTITPLFAGGEVMYTVKYGNEDVCYAGSQMPVQGTIDISLKQPLKSGWNWMSVTNGNAIPLGTAFTQGDVIELRSQSHLVYNDPTYGYFGDITELNADEAMYKVRTTQATKVNMGYEGVIMNGTLTVNIKKGYNWMNNPYEFDIPLNRFSEFFAFTPANGDIVYTQTGFAQYDGTNWVAANGFTLNEGDGLIYYSAADAGVAMTYANLVPTSSGGSHVKAISDFSGSGMGDMVFQYDPYAYPNNMAMVAVVEGLENPEDFTVGVFVNDECRGRGHVVKDNVMFINAVGQSGEQMTFKLVNNATGEIVNLDSTLKYALRQGSLSAPVVLSGAEVTGIMETMADAQQSADESIYDLSGRRVDKMQKGIYIVNGKKVLVK